MVGTLLVVLSGGLVVSSCLLAVIVVGSWVLVSFDGVVVCRLLGAVSVVFDSLVVDWGGVGGFDVSLVPVCVVLLKLYCVAVGIVIVAGGKAMNFRLWGRKCGLIT